MHFQKARLMGVGVSSEVDEQVLKRSVTIPVKDNYFSVSDYPLLLEQLEGCYYIISSIQFRNSNLFKYYDTY